MNITDVNFSFDLLQLAGQDTNLRKSGRWYIGPCPFCGGRDRFSLKHTANGWRWYCRNCGDGKYHSAIDYVMRRDNIGLKDAIEQLGGTYQAPKREMVRTVEMNTSQETDWEIWQKRGSEFIQQSEACLWSNTGHKAVNYLHQRGLKDTTIRRYRLGYLPTPRYEPAQLWGFPSSERNKREIVYIPSGIIIPCMVSNQLCYIKVRQPAGKTPKYFKIKGSQPGIFGADNLRGAWIAMFTEGEFDCMLLDQDAGDL